MVSWPEVSLGEVVDLLTGYPFRSASYTDSPASPRLLRGDNVVQGVLRWEDAKRWPTEQEDAIEAYWLRTGDVVLAMDRPWIEAGLKFASVREQDLPCLLVQRVARLRGTPRLDSRFLHYVIASQAFTDHIRAVVTGTAVPHISAAQIRSYRFRLPEVEEQRAIADVLGALDDKIDMNRRTCATLEAVVRATFQSWFVDFEPVKAKAAGEAPDSICRRLGLTGDVLALFPSTLPEADVFDGWSVGPLERLAVLDKELVNPFEEPDATWEHYSIPAYDEGRLPVSDLGASIKSNKFRVHPNSVLISKLNPHFPRTWLPFVREERRAICSTEFLPLVVREPDDRAFLYGLATSVLFENAMVERVTGTTGSHQRVAPASLLAMSVVTPRGELRRAFGHFATDALRQAAELRSTSAVLAKTRDALLGPLMTGNVRVATEAQP